MIYFSLYTINLNKIYKYLPINILFIFIKFSFSDVPNLLLILTIHKVLNINFINVHHLLFYPRAATGEP
jgi:hypothetical protein